MIVRYCPTCQRNSLSSTGAFWACAACGIAITTQALNRENSKALLNSESEETLLQTTLIGATHYP